MMYLMYYTEGFLKKFPLDKSIMTMGRENTNDLVIREDFISRCHIRINRANDYIVVRDLGSTNGISVNDEKVKEAVIKIGDSFILGKMEFFLKEGSLEEFKLEKELISIFDTIRSDTEKKFDTIQTRFLEDIYSETLKVVMQVGLKKNDFREFLVDLANHLSNLTDFGSLLIIERQKDSFEISLAVKEESLKSNLVENFIKKNLQSFTGKILSYPLPKKGDLRLYSYPLNIPRHEMALLFILNCKKKKEGPKLEEFLSRLAVEIDLLSQLLSGKEKAEGVPEDRSRVTQLNPASSPGFADEIVAENSQMKELIKQAKKIAASDIFVLIQGESGTGKELFARLIHNHSHRAKNKFVALNCAAIPENLLESELFGHEKGAFTSAFTQKKGNLEIASGGTLLLDEIGDMPINLQAKLLRALQEKEFYRLGGTTPIKVDLRIISLTNQDLKQLIKEEKFREDLYYRLVHRIINIPPLRERKEDISALINYFTLKFCKEANKKISGFSIKAFETLQDYHWKGNIRQLENEIRSLVNLTDDGGTVNYDILSEEIKENAGDTRKIPGKLTLSTKKETGEKAYLLKLLEKNNWNKSKTARDLRMTYQGLHKKLKKMGIYRSH